MENKQDKAIRAIDNMLQGLNKPKVISYKDMMSFYQKLEENYDNYMEDLEQILSEEITDEVKFAKLKKISELLEINIF